MKFKYRNFLPIQFQFYIPIQYPIRLYKVVGFFSLKLKISMNTELFELSFKGRLTKAWDGFMLFFFSSFPF